MLFCGKVGTLPVVVRLASGASAAFKVTRTVSRFSGMLLVFADGACDPPVLAASLRGGRTVPVFLVIAGDVESVGGVALGGLKLLDGF